MSSVINKLLLGSIFLLALIGTYNGFGYEQSKILFFIFSITLIGFLWVFRKPKLEWNLIRLASFLFILNLFISSALGINLKNSLLGADPYFQGLLVYAYLLLFSLMVSTSGIKIERWAAILAGSATVVAFLAIKDWVLLNIFQQTVPTYAGRVISSFGQPNFYSGFLLLVLPFWYLLLKKSTKWWLLITAGFLLSVVAIIISESRSAFLILAALFILWLILELKNSKLIILTLILGMLSLATFASFYFTSGLFFKQITEPNSVSDLDLIDLTKISVEQRVFIWPVLIDRIQEKPILGFGLENISAAYTNFFKQNYHFLFEENLQVSPLLIRLKDLNIDRAHNYILDLLLFSGILGLLSWLFLVGLLIKKLVQSPVIAENTTLLLGLFTYLIWVQFQNQSIVHLLYFWLLVGLIDHSLDKR